MNSTNSATPFLLNKIKEMVMMNQIKQVVKEQVARLVMLKDLSNSENGEDPKIPVKNFAKIKWNIGVERNRIWKVATGHVTIVKNTWANSTLNFSKNLEQSKNIVRCYMMKLKSAIIKIKTEKTTLQCYGKNVLKLMVMNHKDILIESLPVC